MNYTCVVSFVIERMKEIQSLCDRYGRQSLEICRVRHTIATICFVLSERRTIEIEKPIDQRVISESRPWLKYKYHTMTIERLALDLVPAEEDWLAVVLPRRKLNSSLILKQTECLHKNFLYGFYSFARTMGERSGLSTR